jgi:hypothetical protein
LKALQNFGSIIDSYFAMPYSLASMNSIDDCFLSRAEVMRRWRVSMTTLKRREQQGILRPIRMSAHAVRYRLSDVVRAEDEAAAGREWGEGTGR